MIWKLRKTANFGAEGHNNKVKILEKDLMENMVKQKKESKT